MEYELLKEVGLVPNIMDDFIKEAVEKEKLATILLYLSAAVREHITFQECILRYEPQKIDENGPRLIQDRHTMMAERIYYETKLRLVKRAPINIESDVVNHVLDSTAEGFVEELRRKLNL